MARKPWWEWDAAELKHSIEVPAGFRIDYYEKPHGNDVWRKYLIEGEPVNLSVSDISGAVDDGGKANGMAYKAMQIALEGVCSLLGDDSFHDGDGSTIPTDPKSWEDALKARKLTHKDVWKEKADLGIATHDALEKLCAGTVPSLSGYEPEVRPYIKAVCGWFVDNDPHVIDTEFLVASREWTYAGRFDLLYKQNGQRVLADLKTSKEVRPAYLTQLAGYSLALEECGYPPVDRMEVIWAKPDGNYKVIPSKATHTDFLNQLAAYVSFNEQKSYLEALAA